MIFWFVNQNMKLNQSICGKHDDENQKYLEESLLQEIEKGVAPEFFSKPDIEMNLLRKLQ